MKDLQKDSLSVELEDNSNNIINPANTNDITIDVNWDDLPDTPYGTIGNIPFHDTTGKIDVNGGGQLQYTLPIALPPGIKSVAPQISLVYTSSSGNGIAGYGWNISGITSISRMGKTIEKDGEVKGVQLDYSDFYHFNGQRLILVSGEYGKDGAEYVTEKYSNVKIKSMGTNGEGTGPLYFEVTFEDGSQAWYGDAPFVDIPIDGSRSSRTPTEYNIVKWKDAQGNYISYQYIQGFRWSDNVASISSIRWGGNENLGTSHFNRIEFGYLSRDLYELSYVGEKRFIQGRILSNIDVYTNDSLFKKYDIEYTEYNSPNHYQFIKSITESNSKGEKSTPVLFTYEKDEKSRDIKWADSRFDDIFKDDVNVGDFNGDGKPDFLRGKKLVLNRLDGNKEFINVNYQGQVFTIGMALKDHLLLNKQSIFTWEIEESGLLHIRSYSFNGIDFELNFLKSIDTNQYPELFIKKRDDDRNWSYGYEISQAIAEGDFDGDGISDFMIEIEHSEKAYPMIFDDWGNPDGYSRDGQVIVSKNIRLYYNVSNDTVSIVNKDINFRRIGNFTGSGKSSLLELKDNILSVYEFNTQNQLIKVSSTPVDANMDYPYYGDFTGDGKTDILAPVAKDSSDWVMYIATGKGFVKHSYPGLYLFQPDWKGSPRRSTHVVRSYFTPDFNKDGKSDFLVFESEVWTRDEWDEWGNKDSTYGFYYYRNDGVDSNGKPIFTKTDWIDRIDLDMNGEDINYSKYGEHYIPLIGNFRIAQVNTEFSIVHKTKLITWDFGKKLNKISRIKEIQQGNIKTEIHYEPAIAENNFYLSNNTLQYPYAIIKENYNQYLVSQLVQEGRKQDFKYRNLISHLRGKGVIGFQQSARSSWYADGYENTKIWSGAEIDPLNEGLPMKEWSVRTVNDDGLIFPSDISVNNNQLLSFKYTDYDVTTSVLGVKTIVPKMTVTKDFLKSITTESSVIYGDYYLPKETTTKVNGDFAVTTTVMNYTHNPTGTGKDYFIGRPQSKTETVTTYRDTKTSKEEYNYENNLLKTLKTYSEDNSGWIQEGYMYDGFGNITEKTISNSVDTMVQNQKSKYEPKGRFVEKKTDNLGLETNIEYNNWGQVTKQTDPLGSIVSNTYDNWGKLLISKTNLGGTTTFTYEKFSDGGNRVIEYAPDGSPKEIYTNKLGQKYKVRTRGINSDGVIRSAGDIDFVYGERKNTYVSVSTKYDILGRKTGESEAYFDQETPRWNTINYNDSVFPPEAVAKAFNGKEIKTSVNGRTTIVEELSGYKRTTKKTTDALDNVISSEDKGGVINFSFNAAGEQTSAKYGNNTVTTQYDVWGRKSYFHDPSNGIYTYEYNGFGQVKKEISPGGYKEYSYNSKGQLVGLIEKSNISGLTDKNISFNYNSNGLLISKTGTSNGKSYSNTTVYDVYGRVLESTENSNGRSYTQKDIVYDNKSRVVSYKKELVSSGVTTSTEIENVYEVWSGQLYQVRDKTNGKILWKLQDANAKGQVVRTRLGASTIENTYDVNNFLSLTEHNSSKGLLFGSQYSFDAEKNELNDRTRHGNFAMNEIFTYDNNNRLIQWTNPKTGGISSNKYDVQGRITENDQIGTIQFGDATKVYQPTGVKLTTTGKQNYLNAQIQRVIYNENNDPLYIQSKKGDVRFEYGLTNMRQMVTYGQTAPAGNNGTIEDFATSGWEGTFTKYYSEDGSFEVVRNNTTGEEKHILYIGGTPYESNVVYLKDFTQSSGSYKFLHKDYLGSILAISDEEGNLVQETLFDAWGNLAAGSISLLGRGYTSHEHFEDISIIHMNGRLYDPLLRRFLNADENIQDPYNTQVYNKYAYVINNPLIYNDPSGEAFGVDDILIAVAIAIFASIATDYYFNRPISFENMISSAFMAVASAGMSYGIGDIFKATGSIATALGKTGTEIARALAHGITGGFMSVINGGSFASGFLSGSFASVGGHFVNKYLGGSFGAQAASGIILGGLGSVLVGGNFWMGAAQGLIVTVFNHLKHVIEENSKVKAALEKLNIKQTDTPKFSKESVIDLTVRDKNLNQMYKDADYPSISLDSDKVGVGTTTAEGITLGPKAFKSYRHLYLALGHEFVHAYQFSSGIMSYWTENLGEDRARYNAERGAYSWLQSYDAPSMIKYWEQAFQRQYGKLIK
ncbi:RHS repeat-associated core domain-containing protein [Elizabethkingia meningoseptica]|uniref:RHS repeat-associated core domain-containing protein n=1 Tax=Elizabethkingia meningoseptica TaxID=238 RepID=UPI003892295D